jgi:hypothetical protein
MRSVNLKKLAAMSALSLVAVIGTSLTASAQYRPTTPDMERKAQESYRSAQEHARAERERTAERDRQRGYSTNGDGYNGVNRNDRYRVYRNGRYYNTNRRGAELLRQAVNAGYQQGYRAGQADSRNRRRMGWNNNNIYNSGNYGYQSYVDRSQYQYYFQQGFQKGYQDGYNRRNQFGSNNGGNIISSILGQILNIQTY